MSIQKWYLIKHYKHSHCVRRLVYCHGESRWDDNLMAVFPVWDEHTWSLELCSEDHWLMLISHRHNHLSCYPHATPRLTFAYDFIAKPIDARNRAGSAQHKRCHITGKKELQVHLMDQCKCSEWCVRHVITEWAEQTCNGQRICCYGDDLKAASPLLYHKIHCDIQQ